VGESPTDAPVTEAALRERVRTLEATVQQLSASLGMMTDMGLAALARYSRTSDSRLERVEDTVQIAGEHTAVSS
jgi:hypothetical protein